MTGWVGRILAAFALIAALVGCGATGTGTAGYVSGDSIITVLPAEEREPVGTVRGETLSGEEFDLADHRGKLVVVNVWGSWCPPCRSEADDLTTAAQALDDVVFVGINTRDYSRENALAFERRYNVTYPSIYDPGGRTLLAFSGVLSPNAIPSTLVIDEQGRVAASILDEVTSPTTLIDVVEEVAMS